MYLVVNFTVNFRLSKEKVHNGIFVGPQIKKLLSNEHFQMLLNEEERKAYDSIVATIKCVLYPSSTPIEAQKDIVTGLITNLIKMGCNYSPKMHCVHSHLEHLKSTQYSVSDEHGEKVHQTMKACEAWYDGKELKSMLADFIWANCV